MKPALLVVTTQWDPEPWAARMRALLPGRTVRCTDRNALYHGPDLELAEVEYVLAWRPRQETLDRLPKLKILFSLGAGVDPIMALPRLPDVPVVRIVDPDLTSRMTEYVVWQVLHHQRRGAEYARLQRQRRWEEVDQPVARDVTVGIMGLGVMGQSAARALVGLGFDVRGWTRTEKGLPGVRCFHGRDGLDAFLAGTDILVSLLPLTPDTAGLIDMGMLRKLRRDGRLGGPILVNAGRGGSQVESDIIEALRDGTLKAASLDVFQVEPLPESSPLWALDNVVITPHVAAISDPASLAQQIAGQIQAFERGEPLRNCVDRRRGY
jgi:glyoxylate/hydroxypyruvate reductase A